MKKKYYKIGFIIIGVILLLLGSYLLYNKYLDSNNKLNISEKEWISDNTSSIITLEMINNVNVLGKDGEGLFFDFFNDMTKEYNLDFNYVSETNPNALMKIQSSNKSASNGFTFYKDHFVIVSATTKNITSLNSLANQSVGITNENNYIKDILGVSMDTHTYSTRDLLIEAFNKNEVSYIIVPNHEYLDIVIENNYDVIYHLSDIYKYYNIVFGSDKTFNNIVLKYFNNYEEKFNDIYNEQLLKFFKNTLVITEKDYDVLTSKVYDYALMTYNPYEIKNSNSIYGIIGVLLNDFTNMSKVEFNYSEYSSLEEFNKGLKNKKFELYFDYYPINTTYKSIPTHLNLEYVILDNDTDYTKYTNITTLKDDEVYVLEGSKTHAYITSLNFSKIKLYNKESGLKKAIKSDATIIMDINEYLIYSNDLLSNYKVRYSNYAPVNYNLYLNGDASLNKLLNAYLKIVDTNSLTIEGRYNYNIAFKTESVLSIIAKYFLILVILVGIFFGLKLKLKNRIRVSKRIRKEDKIKYIDTLTSLKNRTYLSDNIDSWNKNRIYPQTTIILDLNNLKYINDTYGSIEGDKQIKSAANIIIKTQLDNSDIIRTSGNEFLIYLIGYEEKRIASYIKKLYKELNELPYNYGASIGYSMIYDDTKLLDDAINEATIEMRNKKETNTKGLVNNDEKVTKTN